MSAIDTPRVELPQTVEPSSVAPSKLLVIGSDLVMCATGVFIAHALSPRSVDALISTFALLGAWAMGLGRARLYALRFITRRSEEIRRIVDAGMRALGSTALLGFLFRWDISRQWLILAVVIGTGLLVTEREVFRRRFNHRRRNGSMRRPILIVGDNREATDLRAMFEQDSDLGYDVRDTIPTSFGPDRSRLISDVFVALDRTGATAVVIAASSIPPDHMNRLVRDLLDTGIHVELSSTLADIEPHRLTVRPLGRYPVVYVEPIERQGWRAAAKRLFDVTVAAAALLILAPIAAIAAILIKIDSPGPVLFRQQRVGRNGVLFGVLKFRTMVENAEALKASLADANEAAGPLFKMRIDPRVTRVGRVLRLTSFDEVPQLWNVIRGEMSLVGPRPALPVETAAWGDDVYGRLRVRPGITGMWQVSGRSGTTFEEYTRLDLFYVDNWSLVVDLTILLRTIPAVLKSDGAY
ncbi:MAG: sugar transferase [Acidimicrobiales bacterium]|nr:sugar transferase [Acidimicrobiales bacterium]